MRKLTRLTTCAFALSFALLGSSAVAGEMPGYFDYIPASTPYLFATTKPMPEDAVNKIFDALKPLFKRAEAKIARELKKPNLDKGEKVFLELFKGKLNRKGLESLGLHTNPKMALYGLGILPVFRVQLKDANVFKGVVADLEKKIGQAPPKKKLKGAEYWSVSEDGMDIIVAVVGDELVMGVIPTKLAKGLVPVVLGQKKAGKNAAARVKKMMADYGYAGYGVGYVDFAAIADTVMGGGKGLNPHVWSASPFSKEVPKLDATCKKEIAGMVANAPSMTFGYTKATGKVWELSYTLDLKPSLAKDLSKLVAPVPGVGQPNPALFSMGFGLNMGEVLKFAETTIKSLHAKPYKCAMLKDFNQGVAEMHQGLPQLKQVPPFVLDIKGAQVTLKDLKVGKRGPEPQSIKAGAIVQAKDAAQLIGMAKAMVPPLAKLALETNGKPVKLPAELMQGAPVQDIFVAADKDTIAFMVGAGEDKSAGQLLGLKAPAKAALFAAGYDAHKIMALAAPMMGRGDEAKVMQAMMGLFQHIDYAAYLTPKGLVFKQKISLK